ncbi:uncharacterized protein LOC144650866 [Oculina patagonica]
MCESGLPNSVLEIENFWRRMSYNIGGYTFSLDDIEHGILRGNRPHPSGGKPLFADGDPRLRFTVSEVDPRIHFALVCGAKVTLSRIFLWYKIDFGLTEQECLRWISQHLVKEQQEKLKSLLEATDSSIKINYSKYNWDLNGSKL